MSDANNTARPPDLPRWGIGARAWHLGRVGATAVYIEASWPILAFLLAWTLASGHVAVDQPGWPAWQRWGAGLITSALYFLLVLLQEISYLRVAAMLGEKPDRLVLYPFGRASQAGDPPLGTGPELLVTLLGPLSAVAVSALCSLAQRWATPGVPFVAAVFEYSAWAAGLQAVFRLLPGLPLDGGRLLRLVWWRLRKDLRGAGRLASRSGQTLAFALVGLGAYYLVRSDWLSGLWLTTAGWLLSNAAVSSQRQIVVREVMGDITAGGIMEREFITVVPGLDVRQFVNRYVALQHQHAFPVLNGDQLVGIVSASDLARVEPEQWGRTSVADIMTPAGNLITVGPEADGNVILQRLAQRDLHQLPVVQGDRLVGLVSRNDVVRYLQWQTDMGMYN